MLYTKKTQLQKPSENFICLLSDCESDTENDSIAEGDDNSEEEEQYKAVPLASNLQNVVKKV